MDAEVLPSEPRSVIATGLNAPGDAPRNTPPSAQAVALKRAEPEVKSAARTVELLEMLAGEPRAMTLTEIASRLSVPISSVHQLLRTLVARGWLATGEMSGGYTIGVRALMTGMSFLERDPVVQAMKPILAMLRSELNETIHLARLDGARVIYLMSRESENQLRTVSRVGQSLPAHTTALGKAALATLTNEELRERLPAVLEQITPNTFGTLDCLIAELETTRVRGWALEREENTPGTACVAAAIHGAPGNYAVSCSIPLFRLSPERAETVGQTLMAGVRMISDSLPSGGIR